MLRRDLFTSGAALAAASQINAAPPRRPVRMKLGTQHARTDQTFGVLAAFGCEHVCLGTVSKTLDEKFHDERGLVVGELQMPFCARREKRSAQVRHRR